MKLKQFSFEITIEGMEDKPIIIGIEHNLPDLFDWNIFIAAENWFKVTECYTTEYFCQYVNNKTPEFICRPIKVNNQQ